MLLLFQRGGSVRAQTSPGGSISPRNSAGPIHMCFAMDAEALASWEARLGEQDIAIEGRMTWNRGGESIYFRDPDGHLLELMTPGVWPNY